MKVDSNTISSDDKTLLPYFPSSSENITYIIDVKLIFLLLFDVYFNKQLLYNKVMRTGNLTILNNIYNAVAKRLIPNEHITVL